MIESRPDWVISRQRAWGVPITVFQHKETGEVIPSAKFAKSDELMARIRDGHRPRRAPTPGSRRARSERFLEGLVANPPTGSRSTDILDVWFDSGSTHAFTLEDPEAFPASPASSASATAARTASCTSKAPTSIAAGSSPRCWRAAARAARAPFDVVLTHGFILDEKGEEKMSKSQGNTLSPQDVMKTSGADILRLWVASSDYSSDIRFGPAILQGTAEAYRKLRNTLRWMLGTLAHYDGKETVAARGHARAGAADAAPAGRARRARSARPTPTTTTSA